MARDCSDSDSDKERHDRFKSERNPTSGPSLRVNIPSSLESYLPRTRSPSRPVSFKNSRHRSRYSEERKHSPPRRMRSRDRTQPRENDKRSNSQEYKEKHKSKRSHDKSCDDNESRKKSKEAEDKYIDNGNRDSRQKEHKHRSHRDRKRSSREKDRKVDCIKRRKSRDEMAVDGQSLGKTNCQDKSSSEKSRDSDSSVCIKSDDENGAATDTESQPLPRYYEIVDECAIDSDQKNHIDERNSKKHKKTKTQNHHDSKKKKKEKKHKRKHEKRKSDSESDSKLIDDLNKIARLSSTTDSSEPSCEPSSIAKELVEEQIEDSKENDETMQKDVVECTSGEKNDFKRPNSEQEEGELSGSESEQYFGPALPPGKNAERVYGPMRPSGEEQYGPALPPAPVLPTVREGEEKAEEDVGDVIGPVPAGHESNAQSALDARASLLKYHMDNKPDEENQTKREAWMTELPEAKRMQIGLGPRKFRPNAAPDMSDRSSWSDTPQEKLKKLLTNETTTELDTRKLAIMERNKEMDLLAKKSEKKSKSLVEVHQKELKKKKKKEKEKKHERRPFSREIDLQGNIIDEAKTKSVIKKAQLLDSRFSSGESKYL